MSHFIFSQICALRMTERARARVLKAGGEIMTFDQLALKAPKGQQTVIMQGKLLSLASGGHLNMKMNKKTCCKVKTLSWLFYHCDGNPCSWKDYILKWVPGDTEESEIALAWKDAEYLGCRALSLKFCCIFLNIFPIIIPLPNEVGGGVYWIHLVRPSVRP